MNKRRLHNVAETIAEWKAEKITNNFAYFCGTTIKKKPSNLLLIVARIFYAWLPQTNKNSIIYIPKFFLLFSKLYLNFLVHELLHDKFPEKSEKEIVRETNRRLEYWKRFRLN